MTTKNEYMSGGIDFSPESLAAAHEFVRKHVEQLIEGLKAEVALLDEMALEKGGMYAPAVISIANQYRDGAGFQARWDLREKK